MIGLFAADIGVIEVDRSDPKSRAVREPGQAVQAASSSTFKAHSDADARSKATGSHPHTRDSLTYIQQLGSLKDLQSHADPSAADQFLGLKVAQLRSLLGGEITVVEAVADCTVGQLEQEVLRAVRPSDDVLTRKLTVVQLMLHEQLLVASSSLVDSGVSPDVVLNAILSTRSVECEGKNRAGYDLTDEERHVTLNIPEGAAEILPAAFTGCSSIQILSIPKSVAKIGRRAFWNCSSLTSVAIPSSVKSIGDFAFCGCTSIVSLVIPDSVTSIGRFAFRDCSSLRTLAIPTSVDSIKIEAFGGCSSLTSLTIPNSLRLIEDRAFIGCNALTSLTIPSSVSSIEDRAFAGCHSLSRLAIPSSVTNIGEGAFAQCRSLRSLTLPSSLTDIGDHAFAQCTSLTRLMVPSWVSFQEVFVGLPSACEITWLSDPFERSGTHRGYKRPWLSSRIVG